MEDNRIDEVKSEASEVSPQRNTKSQVVKYVAVWVAVVALFLVFNSIIKSVATNTSATSAGGQGAYSAGQPAAYGPGAGTGAGAGAGACGGECCGNPAAAPAGTQAGTQAQTQAQAQGSELETIEKAAIEYYAQKTGDRDVVAEAKSFGCHHEITITKDGKVAAELSLRNGEFSSLRPW